MKFKFFDQCDRFRCNLRREEQWQEMMRRKRRVRQSEFERNVDPSAILDDDETLDDWMASSGDGQFFRSQIGDETVYFIQAAGFEFIFRDPRVTEAARHGMVGTPEHNSWRGMKMRCTNKNHRYYPDYGGRGITVHKTWETFGQFFKDMGNRPKGHTLDRKNVNKGYSPGNCMWSDITTQNQNRRNVTMEATHRIQAAEFVDRLLGLHEATGRFLYHTTSMSALASILNKKTLKPLNGEGFISLSEIPFTGDIRANDVTLTFDMRRLASKLLRVDYSERWFDSHEEQGAYIAGEGWREQFTLPDWLFDPPPDIPPDEADFWEPEPEAVERVYREAEIDAFLVKHDEREWITRRMGEKVKFAAADVKGVLVRSTADESRVMRLVKGTGIGDIPVSAKPAGVF